MTTQISVESLSPIAFKNIPVVTTELLANLYGTESENVKKNYGRNAGRFVEGKHYFKLEGDELREFKHKATNCPFVKIAPNVRHLMLWTERGAARHAKMLETDQAWEVFEKLEDHYFNARPDKKDLITEKHPKPVTVTIPDEGRWLVVCGGERHQVLNIDKHNVVEDEYIRKLERDSNILIELLQNYVRRVRVMYGDESAHVLDIPLIK